MEGNGEVPYIPLFLIAVKKWRETVKFLIYRFSLSRGSLERDHLLYPYLLAKPIQQYSKQSSSLYEASARALDVLDVDGRKYQFNVKNTYIARKITRPPGINSE